MTACCYWGPATSAFCFVCVFSLVTASVPAQQVQNVPDREALGNDSDDATQQSEPEQAAAAPAAVVEAPEGSTTEPAERPAKPTTAPTPTATAPGLTSALVHLYVDYPGAWLELRSAVDPQAWQPACHVPCDELLIVEGKLGRVQAPRMTPSNPFRIEPGGGTANIKVSGGSAAVRLWGIIALSAGLPITLLGGALYGYGSVTNRETLATTGLATLGVGAASVVVSVPLLLIGATTVRDGRGKFIAVTADGEQRF